MLGNTIGIMDLPLARRISRLYCLLCNARFPSESSLLNHVTSHALKTRCVVRLERCDSKKCDSRNPIDSVCLGDVYDVDLQPERFVTPVKLKRVKRRRNLGRFVPNWNSRKRRRTPHGTFAIATEVAANTACNTIEKLELNEPALQFMDCRSDALQDLNNSPIVAAAVTNEDPDNSPRVVNKDHLPVESECLVVDKDNEAEAVPSTDSSQAVILAPEQLDNDDDCAKPVSNTETLGKSPNESTEPIVAPEIVLLHTVNLQYPNLSAEGVHAESTVPTTNSEICWSEATTGLGENGKTGICPICKEQTLTDYDLLRHLEDHCANVEVPEVRFKCIYSRCKKEFKMKGHLTRHYNASGHACPCRFCNLVLKTKSALAEHERAKHAKKLQQIEVEAAKLTEAKKVLDDFRGSGDAESRTALHQSTPERAYQARPTDNTLGKTGDDAEKSLLGGHPKASDSVAAADTAIPCQNTKDLTKTLVRSMLNGASYETSNPNRATALDKSTTNFEMQKTQSQSFLPRTVNMNGSGTSVSYTTASPIDHPKLTVPLQSVIKHFTSNGNLVGPVQLTPHLTLCQTNADAQPPTAASQQQQMNRGPVLNQAQHSLFTNASNHATSVSANRMPPTQQGLQRLLVPPNRFSADPVFLNPAVMQAHVRSLQPALQAMQFHGSVSSTHATGPVICQARPTFQQNALRNSVTPMLQIPERCILQQPTSIAILPSTINVSLPNSVQFQRPGASNQIPAYVATTHATRLYLQHVQPEVMRLQGPAQIVQPQSVIQIPAPGTKPGCSVATASNVPIPTQPADSDWGVQYVTRYNSSDPISTTVPSSNLNIGHIVSPTSGVQYCPATSRESGDQHSTAPRLSHDNSSVLGKPVSVATCADGPLSSVHLLRSHHNLRKNLHCGNCGASIESYLGCHFHHPFCKLLRTCKDCLQVFPDPLKLREHKGKCLKTPVGASNGSRPSEVPASTSKEVQQEHRQLNNSQHVQASDPITRNPLLMNQLSSSLQHRPGVSGIINVSKVTISLPSQPAVSLAVPNAVTQCVSTAAVVDDPTVPCVLPVPSKSAPELQLLLTSVINDQKHNTQRMSDGTSAVTSPIRDQPPVIDVEDDDDDDSVNVIEPCILQTNHCQDQNQEKLQVDAQENEPFLLITDITTVSRTAYKACSAGQVVTEVSPNHDRLPNGLHGCSKASAPTSAADVTSENRKETTVAIISNYPAPPIEDKISAAVDRPKVPTRSTGTSITASLTSSDDNNLPPKHGNATPDAKNSVGAVTSKSQSAIPISRGIKDLATLALNQSGSSKKVGECLILESLPEDNLCNDYGNVSKSSSTLSCEELPDIDMEYLSRSVEPTAHVVHVDDADDSGDCKLVLSPNSETAAATVTCEVCDQEFASVELFDKHWPVHLQSSKRHCIKCAKTFASKATLFHHFRSHLRSCRRNVPRSFKVSKDKKFINLTDTSNKSNWLVPVIDADVYQRYGVSFENLWRRAKFVTFEELRKKLRDEKGDVQVPAIPPC